MNLEEIKSYTGNDNTYLVGHISCVENNTFFGLFDRHLMESIELEGEIDKLPIEQVNLARLGQVIKLDFLTGKLLFMTENKDWV